MTCIECVTSAPLKNAREVLLSAATQRSKVCISKPEFKTFLEHSPSKPVFMGMKMD